MEMQIDDSPATPIRAQHFHWNQTALHQIVVGAGFQPFYYSLFFGVAGHQNDVRVGSGFVGADVPAELQAEKLGIIQSVISI